MTSRLPHFRSYAHQQQTLLDEIDNLRLQGVGEFVFLPQIVVCGDQSSGKSSVLEAISGVPFPRSDTLCTRFATEVILRQAPTAGASVSLYQAKTLQKQNVLRLDGFPDLVERAKSNILRVEIFGPDQPKLTVVDLPGLIQTDSEQHSDVILAVVSAKNDYANQVILKRARQVDAKGSRTLGLITKPDYLPEGSESERDLYRDYKERDWSTAERDENEKKFFSEGVWKSMPRYMVGIGSLRRRLCGILLDQIKTYLPTLMDDMQSNIKECKKKLDKLGDSRDTLDRQRQFLLKLSQSFQTLCRAAVDGNYEHSFFADPSSDDEYCKRLRAVVQNLNIEFSDDTNSVRKSDSAIRQLHMSRKDAIEWVRQLLIKSRGRELPGSFNPLLVGELFRDQSVNWEKIAREHVKKIWVACRQFLEKLLSSIADDETIASLHPITYNHYYTETLQKIRQERQEKELEMKIHDFLRTTDPVCTLNSHTIPALAKSLSTHSEKDMDSFACSELLDSMQAYYKVALKTFVDNVSIQVVERILIADTWSIFSPTDVGQMSPDLVSKIAAESTEAQELRQQLERKLRILEKGMEICQRHSTHTTVGGLPSGMDPQGNGNAQSDRSTLLPVSVMEDYPRAREDSGSPPAIVVATGEGEATEIAEPACEEPEPPQTAKARFTFEQWDRDSFGRFDAFNALSKGSGTETGSRFGGGGSSGQSRGQARRPRRGGL
ncbi:dynamin GTPase [Thermoascus aurantiacus ATCC 26904]